MAYQLLGTSIWTRAHKHVLSAYLMAVTALCTGTALATTITVTTTGPSSRTQCNLTDAIQAATTNTRVNGCRAGQPAPATDTIQLKAGNGTSVTYAGYGTFIWIPAAPNDGGPLVLAGGSSYPGRTVISAQDYGAPPPAIYACPDAAIYTGGSNVTIQGLTVTAGSGPPATGICQYAGNLTVNDVILGPSGENNTTGFSSSAIWSSGLADQMSLIIGSSQITGNFGQGYSAGGLTLSGAVTTTITDSDFEDNSGTVGLPGAISWFGGGDLTISDTTFNENSTAGSSGGALDLVCHDCDASVVLSNDDFENNQSFPGDGAGAINLDNGGNFPLTISGGYIGASNFTGTDGQHSSFQPGWQTYFSLYCENSAFIANVSGSEWAPFSPLSSDGTCQFN